MADAPEWKEWWSSIGQRELRLILWALLDPIGNVPRDEYDSYVPRLWDLLRIHARVLRDAPADDGTEAAFAEWAARVQASEGTVARQLSEWRTDAMGLSARLEFDQAVAEKLSDWLSPPGFGEFRPIDLLG